jgi:GAF domain-containing protein
MRASLPVDEPSRLLALDRYEVLDTEPEQTFDDIARIASFVCRTPMSAVTLIDRDRQWFKSSVGLSVCETPRDDAFCAHTILSTEMMVIEDATQDPRFRDNPMVTGSPNIRFYAGAPLVTTDNFALGSLCVVDCSPRRLSVDERTTLLALSRLVMSELELRRLSRDLAHAVREVKNLTGLVPICSYCKDVRDDKGYWKKVEEYVTQQTGADFSHGLCPKCAKVHFSDPAQTHGPE